MLRLVVKRPDEIPVTAASRERARACLWPRSIDKIPARNISPRNAALCRLSVKTPATNGVKERPVNIGRAKNTHRSSTSSGVERIKSINSLAIQSTSLKGARRMTTTIRPKTDPNTIDSTAIRRVSFRPLAMNCHCSKTVIKPSMVI